ncbi:hypothetical protein D9M69_501120 [compost metagenome]
MPKTVPCTRLTTTSPASAPLATGSRLSASRRPERYTASSTTMMPRLLNRNRRDTSALMVARDFTANWPGPDRLSVSPLAPASPATRANVSFTWAMAASWPSVSEPSARVCSSSMARSPSRDAQTPARVSGWSPGLSWSSTASSSPVGSRVR